MAVPETTMNENYSLVAGKNQIGFSRKVLVMQPEAKTTGMKYLPEGNFRLCILTLNAGHHLAALLRRDDISHRGVPSNLFSSSL